MSKYKIFGSKGDQWVLLRGNINDFKNYTELKRKLIDKSQTAKKKQHIIKESEVFILSFLEDDKHDNYIPNDLPAIWDNKTFSYFKEKLILRDIKDATYKFYVDKVPKLPKWKKKENHEFLKQALDNTWGKIQDDVMSGISLIKLEESKINYKKKKDELNKREEIINKEVHKKVICNNCFKTDLKGKRFICSECNNYNLCQDCEKKKYQSQIHPREHTFIQINKSLKDKNMDTLYKYNNIIGNNNLEFKNMPSSFQIEISIINSGENDLKDCYILPVRYDSKKYITCNPKVIKEEIERNMSAKINLVVRLPHDNKGYFEGYFRMFTPNGLPFGNVLFVKVLNGE